MIHYVHAGWLALAMSPCYGMTETKWHLAKKSAMALIVFAVRVFSSNSTFPSSNCADSSANIPVHNRRPVDNKSMHEFAVCVESPVYRKSPTQIAEFIEMQRVLGAQHITMYIMDDITEKLKLFFRRKYSDNGLLEVVKWKQLRRRTEMHYYGELLLMHDCLYRNMNRAKYLVFVDMDEVILPIQHDSWSNMIIAIDTKPSIGAFVFLNKYFTNNPESTNPAVKPCMELDVPVYFKWTKQGAMDGKTTISCSDNKRWQLSLSGRLLTARSTQ